MKGGDLLGDNTAATPEAETLSPASLDLETPSQEATSQKTPHAEEPHAEEPCAEEPHTEATGEESKNPEPIEIESPALQEDTNDFAEPDDVPQEAPAEESQEAPIEVASQAELITPADLIATEDLDVTADPATTVDIAADPISDRCETTDASPAVSECTLDTESTMIQEMTSDTASQLETESQLEATSQLDPEPTSDFDIAADTQFKTDQAMFAEAAASIASAHDEPSPEAASEPEATGEPETAFPLETANLPEAASPPETVSPPEQTNSPEIIERLELLLQRFDHLDTRLDEWGQPTHATSHNQQITDQYTNLEADNLQTSGLLAGGMISEGNAYQSSTHSDHTEELQQLRDELEKSWQENEELRHQNDTLATQVAESSIHKTVQADQGIDESLSWESRKALILRQMEEDSFDADAFVQSLSTEAKQHAVIETADVAEPVELTPSEFIESLVVQVSRLEGMVGARDKEIGELQMLLQNQSGTRDGGIAIGAAAIASLVDSDELVMEERERLQQLKNDWEDKFRQAEIEASLERAKLSRERQELAKRTQQLEEKIEDLQREKRDNPTPAKTGRRWLAELGIGNSDTP
ncbi:hypothetical protein [Neorhodopirellula lusitana]|uniref:hypothetical protein n=1 Tax=Neorhodopirellula lusitana TaxID=445327 RepID=UPI00384EE13F